MLLEMESDSYLWTFSGVKTHGAALFSSLEDDCFSELGSVEKGGHQNMVLKLLITRPELSQVRL